MKTLSLKPLYKTSLFLASLLIAGAAQASPQAVVKAALNGFEIGMTKEQAMAQAKKLAGANAEKISCSDDFLNPLTEKCFLPEIKFSSFLGFEVYPDSFSFTLHKDKLHSVGFSLNWGDPEASNSVHSRFKEKLFRKLQREMRPLQENGSNVNVPTWEMDDIKLINIARHKKDYQLPGVGRSFVGISVESKEIIPFEFGEKKQESWFSKLTWLSGLRKYIRGEN